MFRAMQEDNGCCEDGETTIAWLGTEPVPGVFHLDTEEVRDVCEESGVPRILLGAQHAYRLSNYHDMRNVLKLCRKHAVSLPRHSGALVARQHRPLKLSFIGGCYEKSHRVAARLSDKDCHGRHHIVRASCTRVHTTKYKTREAHTAPCETQTLGFGCIDVTHNSTEAT